MSSLSERIAANRCAVRDCGRERAPDAAVCRDDLPVAREPEWLARARTQPHGLARPLDRSAA